MALRIGPLNDGDDDPLAGEMKDRQSLTYRRRKAIDDVLKMIGCHHPRNINCDCVDAISGFGAVMMESTVTLLLDGIRTMPRPLTYRAILDLASTIVFQTWISTDTERR